MEQKTSLFKMTPKSLTDEQTKEVFSKFLSIAKAIGIDKLPNVVYTINKEKNRISYKYKQQSNMYERGPEFSISVVTSCQGLEKVQIVSAFLNNCGLCQGAGAADITQRKFKQIENVLNNAFALFRDTCEDYRKKDLIELEFDSIIKTVEDVSEKNTVTKKKKNGYTETLYRLGKIRGEIHYGRSDKTFGFEVRDLTPEKALKLGEVIASL